MNNYKSTEVYQYLLSLYEYLNGDLNEFHKLCEATEEKENATNSFMTSSNAETTFPITSSLSTTTTTETTRYPGDDEATYYKPVLKNDKLFRLTIPITLSLFAAIDCLGFLAGTNNNPLNTNENFRQFFKKSSIAVTDSESDFINNVYRQGLSHVYFPKLGLAISYHSTNPTDKIIFKANNFLVLNVNRLEEIVIKTFQQIKDDDTLFADMEIKYQSLLSQYQTRHGDAIRNYQ